MRLDTKSRVQVSRFDVIAILDPRQGDTGARHAAAAVRALADAGMITGVIFWFGGSRANPGGMAPFVKDLLDHANIVLASVDVRLRTRLLLGFDMRLFLDPAVTVLDVRAEKRIVIVTRRFADSAASARNVMANATEALGGSFALAPVAPSTRQHVETLLPDADVTVADWPPVFLPVPLDSERPRVRRGAVPSIGCYRHTRYRHWPRNFDGLRTALPQNSHFSYRLFYPPAAWTEELQTHYSPLFIHTDGPGHLEAFLASCDFMVTTDTPLDDPYPEEILRGLDVGAIPLLPPDWRKNLNNAAIYGVGEKRAAAALDAYVNPALVEDIRAVWREMKAIHFSKQAFVKNVVSALGAGYSAALVSSATTRSRGTVINLTTNGIGVGHLTRQLAIARRLPAHLDPVFVSFSYAAPIVKKFGYMVEFMPFHSRHRINSGYWNLAMQDYLESLCKFYRPRAFVLDANIPFDALEQFRFNHPELPFIWVRRGMWGEGRDLDALEKAEIFDAVIEPGEVAARYDRGPTAEATAALAKVPPLVLLDEHEVLPKSEAAKELGLDTERLNVLILPGAQNNFDSSDIWRELIAELEQRPDLNVVFANWAISDKQPDLPEHVRRINGYPFHRWFNAFDFAISAAGYNSFAEILSSRLPTIFVPNDHPTMDRQDLRALFAVRHGMAMCLRKGNSGAAYLAVDRMSDEQERTGFRTAMESIPYARGAAKAAEIVSILADAGRTSTRIIQ